MSGPSQCPSADPHRPLKKVLFLAILDPLQHLEKPVRQLPCFSLINDIFLFLVEKLTHGGDDRGGPGSEGLPQAAVLTGRYHLIDG